MQSDAAVSDADPDRQSGGWLRAGFNGLRNRGEKYSAVPYFGGNAGLLVDGVRRADPFHALTSIIYILTNLDMWKNGGSEDPERATALQKRLAWMCIAGGGVISVGGAMKGEWGEFSSGLADAVTMVPTLISASLEENDEPGLINSFKRVAKRNPYLATATIVFLTGLPWLLEAAAKKQWGEVAVHTIWNVGTVMLGLQRNPSASDNLQPSLQNGPSG